MKAIVIRQFGNPNVLNLEDVPQPPLEAGEIAIRVRAATVNQMWIGAEEWPLHC